MKRFFILVFLILASASYALPNPASVYCVEHGGKLKLKSEKGGETGMCIFPDNSYCEEWSYFRKECKPGKFFPQKRHCTR